MAVIHGGNASTRSLDEHLAVLGDEHRQAVIEVLAEEDRSVGLSSLAQSVAAEVGDASSGTLTPRDVERAKVELHHQHLPKLDAAGVLEYDTEETHVAPTDDLQTARDIVESVATA